jgi:hypothetical protein
MSTTTDFNTIRYCIDNKVPCFTFKMDHKKIAAIKWKDITADNFKDYIHAEDNGFAIITGSSFMMLDWDAKNSPPEDIRDFLYKHCSAVEKTPGGFHYWYKVDKRTEHLKSKTDIHWNNIQIKGLDIRATNGIAYLNPSQYLNKDNILVKYEWVKGNLSTAIEMPSEVLEKITLTENPYQVANSIVDDDVTLESFKDNDKQSLKIVPKTKKCLVKENHEHSQTGHSCIYITKGKTTFFATANCFSHGIKKLDKEICDQLVHEYWPEDDHTNIDEYELIKEEFEKNNFKILDPVGFYTKIGHEWRFRERTDMKTAYENILLHDGKLFIDKWFRDSTMKTYDSVGFFPTPADCPESVFNLFSGFKASKLVTASKPFDTIIYHIKVLMNFDDSCVEYFLDWLADILQNPSRLNGKAVIINGQHGCGKDLFIGWFGEKIIGMEHTFRTAKPDKDLFDTFNMSRKNKILMHMEEASKFVMDNANAETFKNMITDPYCSIREMRKDNTQNVKNFNRFVLSTNNKDAVPIAPTERRYFAVRASPKYCNDMEYFNTLIASMKDEGVQKGFYDFLISRDISKRDWIKSPVTEYLKEAKVISLPNIYLFMADFIIGKEDDTEESARDFYQKYVTWCRDANMKMLNERDFGIHIKDIPGVSKEKGKMFNKYIINISTIFDDFEKRGII